MNYRLYNRIAIQKCAEAYSFRKLLPLIAQIIHLKRALILLQEMTEVVQSGVIKGSGEKAFRPKALVVASLAECALSSHFPLLLEAYLTVGDLYNSRDHANCYKSQKEDALIDMRRIKDLKIF